MFDPARNGFGFRNPVGVSSETGNRFLRKIDYLVFGRGLCFGMAVAALSNYVGEDAALGDLPDSSEVMRRLRRMHVLQFRPDVMMLVALYWLCSGGGRSGYALRWLRLAEDPDPHIVCFGPAMSRSFVRNAGRAHAVVPYRVDLRDGETRVYVYDPNHPRSRSRYISFSEDDRFRYEGFTSEGGFGISLVPLSALRFSPLSEIRPVERPI